jgi:hypothetical protein
MPANCNPFTHPKRREAYDAAFTALRKLFPNARESFIRGQAQSKARNLPVAKKPRKPRVRVIVAQTYRAPTRAERNQTHRDKMQSKSESRHGHDGMLPNPCANLSRNHPDYGCTPAKHARRKALRLL